MLPFDLDVVTDLDLAGSGRIRIIATVRGEDQAPRFGRP
jgi:hypothetical protein